MPEPFQCEDGRAPLPPTPWALDSGPSPLRSLLCLSYASFGRSLPATRRRRRGPSRGPRPTRPARPSAGTTSATRPSIRYDAPQLPLPPAPLGDALGPAAFGCSMTAFGMDAEDSHFLPTESISCQPFPYGRALAGRSSGSNLFVILSPGRAAGPPGAPRRSPQRPPMRPFPSINSGTPPVLLPTQGSGQTDCGPPWACGCTMCSPIGHAPGRATARGRPCPGWVDPPSRSVALAPCVARSQLPHLISSRWRPGAADTPPPAADPRA